MIISISIFTIVQKLLCWKIILWIVKLNIFLVYKTSIIKLLVLFKIEGFVIKNINFIILYFTDTCIYTDLTMIDEVPFSINECFR